MNNYYNKNHNNTDTEEMCGIVSILMMPTQPQSSTRCLSCARMWHRAVRRLPDTMFYSVINDTTILVTTTIGPKLTTAWYTINSTQSQEVNVKMWDYYSRYMNRYSVIFDDDLDDLDIDIDLSDLKLSTNKYHAYTHEYNWRRKSSSSSSSVKDNESRVKVCHNPFNWEKSAYTGAKYFTYNSNYNIDYTRRNRYQYTTGPIKKDLVTTTSNFVDLNKNSPFNL